MGSIVPYHSYVSVIAHSSISQIVKGRSPGPQAPLCSPNPVASLPQPTILSIKSRMQNMSLFTVKYKIQMSKVRTWCEALELAKHHPYLSLLAKYSKVNHWVIREAVMT